MVLEELNTLGNRKRALRREAKATVATLDEGYIKKMDLQIFWHVAGLPEYEQANTLFCFMGTSSGIDTTPILKDTLRGGKRVGVPRCISRGIMEVREIRSLRDLEAEKYGIMEPGAHTPVIRAKRINLTIVPCMSYSRGGRRLRYGGGCCDRYLGRTQAVKAVICRERIICADMPAEPHDQMMDMAISGKGVKRLMGQ